MKNIVIALLVLLLGASVYINLELFYSRKKILKENVRIYSEMRRKGLYGDLDLIKEAEDLMFKGRYKEARVKLDSVINYFPSSGLVISAERLIGKINDIEAE